MLCNLPVSIVRVENYDVPKHIHIYTTTSLIHITKPPNPTKQPFNKKKIKMHADERKFNYPKITDASSISFK